MTSGHPADWFNSQPKKAGVQSTIHEETSMDNGTELQTAQPRSIADLTTLMSQPIILVLSGDYWSPNQAKNQLDSLHVNVPRLHADLKKALTPVTADWLQMRLRLMWKSCNPGGGLDATAWLHETARLLADLPQDILAEAIDAAIRASARGFMPTVGEIRTYADPRLRERRQQEWRVSEVMKFSPSAPLAKADRCTPEEAERIRKAAGIRYDDDGREKPADWIPVEQRKSPTRADYLAWGVDPADIPAEAA